MISFNELFLKWFLTDKKSISRVSRNRISRISKVRVRESIWKTSTLKDVLSQAFLK